MTEIKKVTMLIILDGFGYNLSDYGNAISLSKTPFIDSLFVKYPNTTLKCSGLDVGLPDGQMGNSEVGHLNIGSGRIIYQDFTKINKSIEDKTFFKNQILLDAISHAKKHNTALHIQGLLSDGGVHSHINHLFALINLAKEHDVKKLYIHCFLDGRDTQPDMGITYIKQLESHMKKVGLGEIGTISGRYYAMDRDRRWDRVEKAYDALTLGEGLSAKSAVTAIKESYKNKVSDEFVVPTIINPSSTIKDNDSVIMFNFRPDRGREITRALVDADFNGFKRKVILKNLHYVTLTQYDSTLPNVQVAYPIHSYKNTLGEYVSSLGLKQLRIAETEKYAHVTFFFNGGVEAANNNEDRILIDSPKVNTYDMQPEMSAFLVTDKVIEELKLNKYDLIILNFANADMVGHTGDMTATIKAIETLDMCLSKIVPQVLSINGQILLTADHGNADQMLNIDGEKVTSHSTNPVPLLNISNHPQELRDDGALCDLSPTLLKMMDLPIPKEMTGKVLLEEEKI